MLYMTQAEEIHELEYEKTNEDRVTKLNKSRIIKGYKKRNSGAQEIISYLE